MASPPTEVLRNATASCMRCLIWLGITNAETLKAKVLTTAKKSLDSDAPEASGMLIAARFSGSRFSSLAMNAKFLTSRSRFSRKSKGLLMNSGIIPTSQLQSAVLPPDPLRNDDALGIDPLAGPMFVK